MTPRTIIILSSDPELNTVAGLSGDLLHADFEFAAEPDAAALLFASHLREIAAVLVDFDTAAFAGAWVAALAGLQRKIPVIAVSRYHPRFVPEAARLTNIQSWLRKTVTKDELLDALCPFCTCRCSFNQRHAGPTSSHHPDAGAMLGWLACVA